MRLCFDGFCLGPRRPLAVEKSSQTSLTLSNAIETLNITTFFDKTSPAHHFHLQHNSEFDKENINIHPNYYDNGGMITSDDPNVSRNNSEFNSSVNDSTMYSDNNSMALPSHQALTESIDSQNNNISIDISSQTDLVNRGDAVDMLNNTVQNIFINEGNVDVNMQEVDSEQNLTAEERDLIKIIQIKDMKIKELEDQLRRKDEEIANLKSHLDKFQSVFPFHGVPKQPIRKIGNRNIQRQRAQGISAEPQSESSMHDLLNVTFPKYEKDEQ